MHKSFTLGPGLLLLPLLLAVAAGMAYLTLQGMETFGLLGLWGLLVVAGLCLRPEMGIVFFMTTFFVTYSEFLPMKGPLTPNNLLGLLFVILLIVQIYREQDLWFVHERSLQLLFTLTVFMFVSSYIAEQSLVNTFEGIEGTSIKLDRMTTRFAFLLFFVNFIRTTRDLKLVLWTLVGIILLTAASAVPSRGGYRLAATLGIAAAGNANWFAFFCVFGMAFLWSYRQAVRRNWLRLLFNAAVGGLAISVLLTGSRSGLLNLALLFALMTLQGRFSLKKQIQIALVMLLAGYGALSMLTASHFERLGNIPFIGDASSVTTKGAESTAGRLSYLREGVKMVVESPLIGIGIGNFTWYYEKQSGRVGSSPHNSYLAAAVEGGIPALLLYLMVFGYTFRHFGRVERETHDPELRAIASGLRLGMIVFLFFSLFAEFWLNIMTYLLVGCAIVLKRVHEQDVLASFSGVATGAPRRVRLA